LEGRRIDQEESGGVRDEAVVNEAVESGNALGAGQEEGRREEHSLRKREEPNRSG
jgi:hypothetical protein